MCCYDGLSERRGPTELAYPRDKEYLGDSCFPYFGISSQVCIDGAWTSLYVKEILFSTFDYLYSYSTRICPFDFSLLYNLLSE